MIHIILQDEGKNKRKKYQSSDHDQKHPLKDVHKLKEDIIDESLHSGKFGKKEIEQFGKNCDLGVLNGKIILKSKIHKGKVFDTGLNAEDFFDLLLFMLKEIEIYDSQKNKNISWNELQKRAINEQRKMKIISIESENEDIEEIASNENILIMKVKGDLSK